MSFAEKFKNSRNPDEQNDDLEARLKSVWANYIHCVDRYGSDAAKALRDRYFDLYRTYRQNQRWKSLIAKN